MTANGEVVPLGPVDKDGHRVPLDTTSLYGPRGECYKVKSFVHFPLMDGWFMDLVQVAEQQFDEERLICPYCESSISDPWEYDEDVDEIECPACGRAFEVEITTVYTYRTRRRMEDMPDGWDGGDI